MRSGMLHSSPGQKGDKDALCDSAPPRPPSTSGSVNTHRMPCSRVSLHTCKRRSFLCLFGSSHANAISTESPISRVSMTTRSYHAENIDQGVKAIPRVLHTRPHNAVNALCCVGRPLHHRSSFRNISSLHFFFLERKK